jgi:sarcosine oxidase subunit alpha
MLSKVKDFVGRTMAERPALTAPERPRLVGIRPVDPAQRPRAGAHFLPLKAVATAAHDQGYLTSVAFSPTVGRWIGLGLLAHGPERHGERVRAYDPLRGGDVEVEVCPPVFVDPEGARLHG